MDRCCVAEGGRRLKCRAIDEKMVDKRCFSLRSDEDVRDYFGKQGNFSPNVADSLSKHEKSANSLFALFCFTAAVGLKM